MLWLRHLRCNDRERIPVVVDESRCDDWRAAGRLTLNTMHVLN